MKSIRIKILDFLISLLIKIRFNLIRRKAKRKNIEPTP